MAKKSYFKRARQRLARFGSRFTSWRRKRKQRRMSRPKKRRTRRQKAMRIMGLSLPIALLLATAIAYMVSPKFKAWVKSKTGM